MFHLKETFNSLVIFKINKSLRKRKRRMVSDDRVVVMMVEVVEVVVVVVRSTGITCIEKLKPI